MLKFGESIHDYEIKEVLGKGGFATVYRARCLLTGYDVAIKMIDKKLMRAAGMVSRVKQEVSIHSRLKHPSVLELYTFFEDPAYVYLILELCHNGELQRFLRTTKSILSEPEACNILKQVVEGLLYLHSHKIVHRDMSLANLLLTKEMNIKIADFGLATQLRRFDEKHHTMCGTPNYISPEVATSSSHGLETDVWGLGVMLYTMLVGKPPFDTQEGLRSTLTHVVMSEVFFPPLLSPEAKDLISCLLVKNPKERMKLRDIMTHVFMLKNGSCLGKGFESGRRWCSYDSGVDSSSQNSHLDMQRDIPVLHSGRVPVLNGAFKTMSNSLVNKKQLSNIERIPCCNGHSLTRRNDDCSHCNPASGHAHACSNSCTHSQLVTKIPVPPISSFRLLPVRQKTKNVVVNILESGEVCLEFLKSREGSERVGDVLRISPDGQRIVLYQPNKGKGVPVSVSPPPLPQTGADSIFSYESIPEKHWKKYSYAAKFVELVKSKTPKVTFYSKSAKCFLMENSDFEACFYEGGKIAKSKNNVKLIESNGESLAFDTQSSIRLSPNAQLMWEHFEKCLKHCIKIESRMDGLSKESEDTCFPLIIGRRPPQYLRPTSSSLNDNNKENSPNAPSIVNVRNFGGYESSVLSSSSKHGSTASKTRKVLRECEISNVGQAVQYGNGDICMRYRDGTTLSLSPNSIVTYCGSGGVSEYKLSDSIPGDIRGRLSHFKEYVSALMGTSPSHSLI